MDDTVVMQVRDGGEGSANEFSGVEFVVATFAADTVKELAAEGEIGH